MKIDEPSASSAREVRESLLQSLIDQSPAFIAVRAIDGIYLYANNAFAGALGVLPEQIVGHREEDLLPGAGIPPLLRAGSAAAERGEVRSAVEDAVIGTCQRRLLIARFPIRAHGEIFATGLIASDIGAAVHAESGVHASLERAEASNAELRRALERMERLAYTDRLTGAWNRRHLDDAVVIEMSRTERHGHPVSMLLIDIDHFKALNDDHGRPVGDLVLIELVRCLRAGLRRADTVTRWGGEEFVVLAPDTPLAEAGQLAHKLGLRVAASILSEGLPGPVTVSIGGGRVSGGRGLRGVAAACRPRPLPRQAGRAQPQCRRPADRLRRACRRAGAALAGQADVAGGLRQRRPPGRSPASRIVRARQPAARRGARRRLPRARAERR
jgi:diguanylate cyclase (GGDEF)-like protein